MYSARKRRKLGYVDGLKTICRIRMNHKVEEKWLGTLDTYKSANCTRGRVSMQMEGYSSCENINIRVDVDGLFSWLRDVHCVGMTSRAVICLVKMHFMGRVLIQEL